MRIISSLRRERRKRRKGGRIPNDYAGERVTDIGFSNAVLERERDGATLILLKYHLNLSSFDHENIATSVSICTKCCLED